MIKDKRWNKNSKEKVKKKRGTCMEQQYYKHLVQYYETDQMKIVHHSNYIRWFEEARSWYLEQAGFGYDKMEETGVISPVLEVQCRYKSMVRYGEEVYIIPHLVKFNGIKMVVEYEIKDVKTGELRATGQSSHGFLNREYKPISLKKENPEIYQVFFNLLEEK